MKEIRAIVRPNRLERLREALRAIPNFPGVTMLKAEGFTAPAALGKRSFKEELTEYTEKIMVAVLVEDSMVAEVCDTIVDICHTGNIGDGLVWVVPIEQMIRMRTKTIYP